MRTSLLLGSALLGILAACGGDDAVCAAGETVACTGPGGCLGAALCDSDGVPGTCICGRIDASVRDGGRPDGRVPPGPDASQDAAVMDGATDAPGIDGGPTDDGGPGPDVPCTPRACALDECGDVSDDCGGTISCSCPAAPACRANSCVSSMCMTVNAADGTACPSGECTSGTCAPCGASGEACCAMPPVCRGSSVTCVGSTCETSCGESGEPCCGGTACMSGATCVSSGTCYFGCGGFMQVCCPGDLCAGTYECMAGVCTN